MAYPNADTVIDDAADLQFPKDWTSSNKRRKELGKQVKKRKIASLDPTCFICKCLISEPYIRCAICNDLELCTSCFANGQEKADHKNNHNYIVIKNNFLLTDSSDWTAKEEKNLLQFIQDYGYGNWTSISHALPGRSPEDCKKHYIQYYINNQLLPGIPKIEETPSNRLGIEPIPYLLKLEDIEDPPRFAPGTLNYKLLAGYNPARSDFEYNFDNNAEQFVAKLKYDEFSSDDSYDSLGQELQIAMISAYNMRLMERFRRAKVIRDHGLISLRKVALSLQRYDETIPSNLLHRLKIFAQLVGGIEFDLILECLHAIGKKKNYLRQLFNYRRNGIEHFHSIPMFEELSKLRQEFEKEKKQYTSNLDFNWRNISPAAASETTFVNRNISQRRAAPPLDLHPGMVAYEKLSAAEKTLCSVARVLPEVYIHFKNLLINENKKYSTVTLAQARKLLSIDVNKTKKIHEFLVNEGYINKS